MKKAVKITAAVLAAVSVLAVLALFSPPIIKIESIAVCLNSDIENSLFDEGFTANKLLETVKKQPYWCLKGVDSDSISNYCFFTVSANVKNYSFFDYTADDFRIISVDEKYSERFICIFDTEACSFGAFDSGNITVMFCLNTRGLKADELEQAIKSVKVESSKASRSVFDLLNVDTSETIINLAKTAGMEIQVGKVK